MFSAGWCIRVSVLQHTALPHKLCWRLERMEYMQCHVWKWSADPHICNLRSGCIRWLCVSDSKRHFRVTGVQPNSMPCQLRRLVVLLEHVHDNVWERHTVSDVCSKHAGSKRRCTMLSREQHDSVAGVQRSALSMPARLLPCTRRVLLHSM